MDIENKPPLDLLDTSGAPALSSVADMPVVETKPDAQNEGAPPAAPAETKAVETDSESATEPGDEPPASDEPKKAKGVQKRLDELVRQREEAERRAESERAEKLRLMTLLEERLKPEPPAKAEVSEPVRPNRGDFDDPNAYDEALISYAKQSAEFVADTRIREEREATHQEQQRITFERESEVVREAFAGRLETFKSKQPDFDEVIAAAVSRVSMEMANAILESDVGPALQYHLAQHPEDAARIMALTPARQLREMGKLEAKLSAPAPVSAPVSAAPRPIKPTTPSAETVEFDPETASMDQYAEKARKRYGFGDPQRRH